MRAGTAEKAIDTLEGRLAETVLARCDALAGCSDQDGVILRTFLSPAMERCHQLVRRWMASAGMHVTLDRAGNLRGLFAAAHVDAPRLIIASHLDTVPDAGKYDGILGVMLGISLVESLEGKPLPFAVEVIGFSDEEGVRFGLPFIGSRAAIGTLTAEHQLFRDVEGVSLATALEKLAVAHPDAVPAALHPRSTAYLEFHIEQGPVLEDGGQPLAVVDSIAGQNRGTFLFRGHAGHAGTTPMDLRRDAMTAAAEWMLAVESLARATPGVVASTGRVVCEPGVSNIIPGSTRCSLDVRSSSDELRRATLQSLLNAAQDIARRRRIEVTHTIDADQPTVRLDPSLTRLAESAVRAAEVNSTRMVSGAGHDAVMLAPHLPSAMIFLRSPGGISHHPAESVLAGDVALALRAGFQFLEQFPQWLEESERRPCTI